jgi:hypothetical protein
VDVGAFESGSTASSGSVGIGSFPISVGPRRIGFVFAINVSTIERRTALLRPSGSYRFSNLELGDVYVFDYHIKNRTFPPFVFAPEF